MSLTQLIWIAGLVVFFIVGMSIAHAISALVHQLDKGITVKLENPIEVELETDALPLKVELNPLELGNHILPLKVEVEPLKLENHILPLKVAAELDTLGPLSVELTSNALPSRVRGRSARTTRAAELDGPLKDPGFGS
jgi:hypothetical protein